MMKKEDILAKAVKRYEEAVDADRDNREHAIDDLRFLTVTGDGHWPEEVRRQREDEGKPCITINRLPQYLRQVTGDIRRVNPAIKIVPADGEASTEMAEIKGGMIRQIEAASSAASIYEGAAESAAGCGMGAFRVLTRYCDDDTFDQEIYLEGVRNVFSVHWDPLAKDPTRKDARYCFITDEMDLEAFEEEYPEANPDSWKGEGTTFTHWQVNDRVTVAEYWWKEPTTERIVQLPDGRILTGEDVKLVPKGTPGVRERKVETNRVMWAKMTAGEVLEGPQEWPGKHLPIVAVMGEELHVGEEIIRTSVVRYAKEPQQLYNYWRSAQAEVIALQPKAPYLVTAMQIEGLEAIWRRANQANLPYLPYNPDPSAPPPQRSTPPVASQAMMQEIAMAVDDLKATTGIYDAGLGATGNETSGVAIKQRQIEGDISTSIYVDNLAQSIEQAGRVILDLMPNIYDNERVVRVLGEDGAERMERINAIIGTPAGPMAVNSIFEGKYDVNVSTGPAYSTLRQEAAEGMLAFVQAFPQAAPAISDLIAKNSDWPGAEQIAKRLKRLSEMTMPGLIEEDEKDLTPEEMRQRQQAQAQQSQMAQMQQQMAQQAQQLQELMARAEVSEREASARLKDADAAKKQAETLEIQATLGMKSDAQAFDQSVKAADMQLRAQDAQVGQAKAAADIAQKQAQTWRAANEPFRSPPGGDRPS